jgi:succinyl-CoA synthetase beta subunit
MLNLTEDLTKQWLRSRGIPVPRGDVVHSADAAAELSSTIPGGVVVKALVPTGRRGKVGAVRAAVDMQECRIAASEILGEQVHGYTVNKLYVEERVQIREEYYLSFSLSDIHAEVLLSRSGGVDIEALIQNSPDRMVRAAIDPLRGLSLAAAIELWLEAGLQGPALPQIAALTCQVYDAFCAADALLLEINPLAVDQANAVVLVGAMMGIDESALFRHAIWRDSMGIESPTGNPRERSVAMANRAFPGGECQYVELEGNIGLLVGGGGAGLYQHDLMLELGGLPANHCVTPPTGADNRKLKAVLSAILDNPKLRGLLIGFNFAQMARTDIRIRTLVEVLDEKKVDTSRLPIVIRLFGTGEAESRSMVAGRQNIHYTPRGTTLRQAVRLIVELVARGVSP